MPCETKVNQALESICLMGCGTVNAIIKTLESGNKVDGMADFSNKEIKLLTKELKSIMAIYNQRK